MDQSQGVQENLVETFLTIQKVLGLSDCEFWTLLGVSSEREKKLIKNQGPSLFHFDQLSRNLDLNAGLLLSGSIDWSALVRRYQGNSLALPKRYTLEKKALSRSRGIYVIYKYLETFHGELYARQILGRFQVYPEALEDLVGYVSPRLGVDILAELRREGFCDEALQAMGAMTLSVNKGNLGKVLRKQKSGEQLYDYLHQEVLTRFYDRAFKYELGACSKNSCFIYVRPTEEARETFRGEQYADRDICVYKQGAYLSFIWNLPILGASLKEHGCIYKGDPECIYEITWY